MVRESEWTDDDRKQMRELELYEAGLHKCGYHRDLLNDKSNIFMPDEWTCPVCAGLAQRGRMLRQRDERAVGKGDDRAAQPGDGRDVYMRLLPPAEAEQVRAALREQRQG